jgi:hypothetical protein
MTGYPFYAIRHDHNPIYLRSEPGLTPWTYEPTEALRFGTAEAAVKHIIANLDGKGAPVKIVDHR